MFGVLFTVLLLLTVAMQLAMPVIVQTIIAPALTPSPRNMPPLSDGAHHVSLSDVHVAHSDALGMLNSLQHFFAAAIAPVFLNLLMIAALAWAIWFEAEARTTALYLSYAVLAAGILQLAVLYAGVRHAGMSLKFRRPRLTDNVKRLLWLALPAAITGGVTQINQLVGQMIASGKDGAIAALQFADRLYQLPLGVVGIAVGVVLLPELSRALRAGRVSEAGNIQNRSMEFVLFLTLPAAVAIWVMSQELIRVVFEHGAFTPAMTENVFLDFGCLCPWLAGICHDQGFDARLFCREDTKTPMRITMISVAVNCLLAVLLFPQFTERGIAAAAAVSGWLSVIMLFAVLVHRGHWQWDRLFVSRSLRLALSAMVMAFAVHFATGYASPWLQSSSPLTSQVPALLALIGFAMLVYFAVAFAIGGASFRTLVDGIKRKGASGQEPKSPTDTLE